MNIQQYIQSGIIEEYVMGLAPAADKQEFENLLPLYPELRLALYHYEMQLEEKALADAIPPPPGLKKRTQDVINKLPAKRPLFDESPPPPPFAETATSGGDAYIPIESQDTHIKVHKYWRLVVLAVFIFAKICLGFMLYFAIQYYETKNELKDLQKQIQHISEHQKPRS
ncbi:MAG: hypothetical protein QM731_27955 [Chitinophagaceae bacterium]